MKTNKFIDFLAGFLARLFVLFIAYPAILCVTGVVLCFAFVIISVVAFLRITWAIAAAVFG